MTMRAPPGEEIRHFRKLSQAESCLTPKLFGLSGLAWCIRSFPHVSKPNTDPYYKAVSFHRTSRSFVLPCSSKGADTFVTSNTALTQDLNVQLSVTPLKTDGSECRICYLKSHETMSTHNAIVTTSPGKLSVHQVPTPSVSARGVKLVNQWTASTPLDLHQTDGHLLVNPPQVLGDGVAGTVLEVGSAVKHLQPGDQVFGFTWREQAEKAHQLYVVTTENVLAKLPEGMSMPQVVTVPNNFVTAWHALRKDLGFELPWPKPEGYEPEEKEKRILVWGGSSSVGMYTLQILNFYGYENVVTTASSVHHGRLLRYGARACFDYRDHDVLAQIRQEAAEGIDFVLDCIGSLQGSVEPIAQLVTTARIAVLLPIVLQPSSPGVLPSYSLDVLDLGVSWPPSVTVSGVRTHNYTSNSFLAEKLQPEIMPWMLAEKIIESNERISVEGETLLERAEKALGILREKGVSGARLVWRVAEEGELEGALSGRGMETGDGK